MLPSPATKAAAISDYLAGKGGYFQIANEFGASPDAYLCIETVRLLTETVDLKDTIIHSDQGSSYTSYE